MKVLCEAQARVVCPGCGTTLELPRKSVLGAFTRLLREFLSAHGRNCPAQAVRRTDVVCTLGLALLLAVASYYR